VAFTVANDQRAAQVFKHVHAFFVIAAPGIVVRIYEDDLFHIAADLLPVILILQYEFRLAFFSLRPGIAGHQDHLAYLRVYFFQNAQNERASSRMAYHDRVFIELAVLENER